MLTKSSLILLRRNVLKNYNSVHILLKLFGGLPIDALHKFLSDMLTFENMQYLK